MHWLTVVLIFLLVFLSVAFAIICAIMFSNRPTEINELAGEPALGELRIGHSQGEYVPRLHIPSNLSENEQRINSMTVPELEQELLRIVQGEDHSLSTMEEDDDEESQEGDERAVRLLSTVTNTSRGVPRTVESAANGEGRGIVICAGGFTYGTCAYILLRGLREQGCDLPVEIWHKNDEMSAEMQNMFESFQDVEVRNIEQVASLSIGSPFAMKPLSVYYSKFQQVLLLDADNITVDNPIHLFDLLHEDTPAVFWPDYWPIDRNASCWNILTDDQKDRMTYIFTQDSGQLLVDKKYCLNALSLCCKINVQLHSQLKRLFPKPFNEGDRDTWHFSWLATDTPFRMISQRAGGAGTRIDNGEYIGNTIVQYDINGTPVFLHKRVAKWATQTSKPQWNETIRFIGSRGRVDRWTFDFSGATTKNLFIEEFGDIEERCWNSLNEIRKMGWYEEQFEKQLLDIK